MAAPPDAKRFRRQVEKLADRLGLGACLVAAARQAHHVNVGLGDIDAAGLRHHPDKPALKLARAGEMAAARGDAEPVDPPPVEVALQRPIKVRFVVKKV